jgi:hypothetical protein
MTANGLKGEFDAQRQPVMHLENVLRERLQGSSRGLNPKHVFQAPRLSLSKAVCYRAGVGTIAHPRPCGLCHATAQTVHSAVDPSRPEC